MAKVQGSYGLIIDLGHAKPEAIRQCYDLWWSQSQASEPQTMMGEWQGIPQATTGKLTLHNGLQGECYTRLEHTQMGFPAGYQSPIQLHISVHSFTPHLPEHPALQLFLGNWVEKLYQCYPFKAAFLCDLTSFYLVADLISPLWFDWQQEKLWCCWLPAEHPWAKAQHSTKGLHAYTPSDWQAHVTNDSEEQRYDRLRQYMKTEIFKPQCGSN